MLMKCSVNEKWLIWHIYDELMSFKKTLNCWFFLSSWEKFSSPILICFKSGAINPEPLDRMFIKCANTIAIKLLCIRRIISYFMFWLSLEVYNQQLHTKMCLRLISLSKLRIKTSHRFARTSTAIWNWNSRFNLFLKYIGVFAYGF